MPNLPRLVGFGGMVHLRPVRALATYDVISGPPKVDEWTTQSGQVNRPKWTTLIDPPPRDLNPKLETLKPQTLNSEPCLGGMVNPQPSPLNTQHATLNPHPSTLNPQPSTLHPPPSPLNPQPSTLNPPPSPLSPTPSTLNPQQPLQASGTRGISGVGG